MKKETTIIVGASQGLGYSLAKQLAQHGDHLTLIARNAETLGQVSDSMSGSPRPCAMLAAADIGRQPQIFSSLADEWQQRNLIPQRLIFCAHHTPTPTPLDLHPQDEWDYALAVNLRAPLIMLRDMAPILRDRNHPQDLVFFVCRAALPYGSTIMSCRAALVESLAHYSREVSDIGGIHVYAIDPGPFFSCTWQRLYPGVDASQVPSADTVAKKIHNFLRTPQRHRWTVDKFGVIDINALAKPS